MQESLLGHGLVTTACKSNISRVSTEARARDTTWWLTSLVSQKTVKMISATHVLGMDYYIGAFFGLSLLLSSSTRRNPLLYSEYDLPSQKPDKDPDLREARGLRERPLQPLTGVKSVQNQNSDAPL